MLRRSFLQLALAVCSILPSRKLPVIEEQTSTKSLAYAVNKFQVPVWSPEEFKASNHPGYLAYCIALDIASSEADLEERYAYLQYIKRRNPDLHSFVQRELGSMTQPVTRLDGDKWTDGECWSTVGDLKCNIRWQQLVYVVDLPAGPHYITGAMWTRLCYMAPGEGQARTYWISSEEQAGQARCDFAKLAAKLPDGEARENLLQMARACHVSIG